MRMCGCEKVASHRSYIRNPQSAIQNFAYVISIASHAPAPAQSTLSESGERNNAVTGIDDLSDLCVPG